MSSSGIKVPVGLPGEQRKVSLMGFGVAAAAERVALICWRGGSLASDSEASAFASRAHLIDLWPESSSLNIQVQLDDLYIVDLRTHAVHAIGGRANEDSILAGYARDAEEQIDSLVGAYTEEDVGRGRDVAKGADLLLEVQVERGRVAVKREVVKGACLKMRRESMSCTRAGGDAESLPSSALEPGGGSA